MSGNSSEELVGLSKDVRNVEMQLIEARERRDQKIRDAIKIEGLTMYAVSRIAGLTQPSIKKIMDK